MRLEGRVAIVTGGGFGIGRAYSLGLAREGSQVVIADINDESAAQTERMIREEEGEAIAVHVDVADKASTAAMAQVAMERFGRIDILVNNAALFSALPLRTFDEMEVEEWDRVMAVNLRGPFLCAKAVVPYMKEQGYGKIINISSGSILTGNARRIHYVTSKSGLLGFTRSLARALGGDGIRVNTILPGGIMSEGALAAYGPEHYERSQGNKSLKQIGMPEDLVGTLIFLSSSDSDYVSGAALSVDGGTHMY